MLVSHKKKFIFICNGKTGTTSIEKALSPYVEDHRYNFHAPGLWDNKHMPPAIAQAVLPSEVWESYFKFVFVRNPYDWFVSLYKHNFRLRLSLRKLIRHPFLAPGMLLGQIQNWPLRKKKIYTSADVVFLYSFLKQFRALPLADSLFQSSYAYSVNSVKLVNFVGKYENLRTDFHTIQQRIGTSVSLPHLNPTKHPHFSQCLDASAKKRIEELWELDFLNFDYPFDSERIDS